MAHKLIPRHRRGRRHGGIYLRRGHQQGHVDRQGRFAGAGPSGKDERSSDSMRRAPQARHALTPPYRSAVLPCAPLARSPSAASTRATYASRPSRASIATSASHASTSTSASSAESAARTASTSSAPFPSCSAAAWRTAASRGPPRTSWTCWMRWATSTYVACCRSPSFAAFLRQERRSRAFLPSFRSDG